VVCLSIAARRTTKSPWDLNHASVADLAAGLAEVQKHFGLFKHRSKAYDKKPLGPELH